MYKNNNIETFFALVKAGLWEDGNADIRIDGNTDWNYIYRLAQEQSVQGLVLRGIEELRAKGIELNVPKVLLLQWIGDVQIIEQKNQAMNTFINQLIFDLRKSNIYTLIVKGQGIAQCYERPLWRSSGDIDLYLNEGDFQKAKIYFRTLVDKFDPDDDYTRHINMYYGEWVIEIHANQYCSLSPRIDNLLDEVHRDLFYNGNVRSWMNNGNQVFLPSADNDVIIVFTHFLKHFYKGGIGLRQICDWCRLLWTYRDTLDLGLLERRIRKAGLLDEWRAFGAYAVSYLGMPVEAMPLLDGKWKMKEGRCVIAARLKRKADRINEFIIEVGNFGHNRDTSYYGKYPFLVRKTISAWRRMKDLCRHAMIFPLDSLRFFFGMTISSFKAVSHGD